MQLGGRSWHWRTRWTDIIKNDIPENRENLISYLTKVYRRLLYVFDVLASPVQGGGRPAVRNTKTSGRERLMMVVAAPGYLPELQPAQQQQQQDRTGLLTTCVACLLIHISKHSNSPLCTISIAINLLYKSVAFFTFFLHHKMCNLVQVRLQTIRRHFIDY